MNNIEILYDDDGDDNDDETCRLKMTDLKIKNKNFFSGMMKMTELTDVAQPIDVVISQTSLQKFLIKRHHVRVTVSDCIPVGN